MRYLENFFKDILNIVYGYKLINLNEERSNNPGLAWAMKRVGEFPKLLNFFQNIVTVE
ncbi:SMEK domain-containing protein [Undibacterium sp. Jales W-56]|uniref:SMEK domain-containing protein n=1 Tax=Undibacterium sp. Jales W-56 TaxID=2897325 RepID=UPI003977C730